MALDYPRLLLTLEDSVVTFAFLGIAQRRPLPDSFDSHVGSLQAVLVQLSVFVLAADVGGLPGRLPEVEKFSFHHGGNIFFLYFAGHGALKVEDVFSRTQPLTQVRLSYQCEQFVQNLTKFLSADHPQAPENTGSTFRLNCDLRSISGQTLYSFPPRKLYFQLVG